MNLTVPLAILWIGALALAPMDGRRRWVGAFGLVILAAALVALLAVSREVLTRGVLQVIAGGWPEGVGIRLRLDALGIAFALTSLVVVLVAYGYEFAGGVTSRSFPALAVFLAAGLVGVFFTGDAFNFYVFFEISMVSSYVLTAYGEERRQLRAAVIFAVVNLLGSVIFLIAIVSLYHVTGTLDMELMARRMPIVEQNPSLVAGTLLFVALCVKLGIFPFHFWLPAVYTGVHPSVAAMLSGALATIGAYGFLRFGAGMLPRELDVAGSALITLGVASVLYGGIQAIARHRPAEVVSYSAIGQVGYILIALAVGGPVGYAAAILFSILNSVNKTLLFLAGDLTNRYAGIAYAIGGLSVAGIPLAAGFWGKTALIRAGFAADSLPMRALLVGTVVLGGFLSVIYMFQSYGRSFWLVGAGPATKAQVIQTGIALALGIAAVTIGIWPEPLLALSAQAAAALGGARP
ncbi:MAG: proton-conducting transporter membrane subunit [Thermomicrobiales bacterium]